MTTDPIAAMYDSTVPRAVRVRAAVGLAARPVEDPDQLALYADNWTPTAKPFADAFRDACKADADAHDGIVNPNHVRLALMEHDDYDPRQLSSLWSAAASKSGYLVTLRDCKVPIAGEGSKGNGNKDVPLRRWVGEAS